MASGGRWTAGKVILLIAGILFGLVIVCCGVGWFVVGDKIMAGIRIGTDMASFEQKIQADFGKTSYSTLKQDDQNDFVLLVGVDDELTPARVKEVQDKAWKTFAETFRTNGTLPIKHVAVGKTKHQSGARSGIVGWTANSVSVEDLVKRTGVASPPVAKFLPEDFENKIHVEVNTVPDDQEDKEGGGGGGGK